MRILLVNLRSELVAVALASALAVATSACLPGQDFVSAPLPNYYAGHTAAVQIAERARSQAAVVSQGKPIQATPVATSPVPSVLAPASDSNVVVAQNKTVWLPRRGNAAFVQPQQGNSQSVEGGLPANRIVVPGAPNEAGRTGKIDAEGTEVARQVESFVDEKADLEVADLEAEKSDAGRRGTLRDTSPGDGEVYDGLPVEGRFERRRTPRVHIPPKGEPNAVRSTEAEVKQETNDGKQNSRVDDDNETEEIEKEVVVESQNTHENEDASQHEDIDDEDGDDGDGDDDDDDCEDQLAEHFEAVERVLDSEIVRKILGLKNENTELKAQLKIQAIEFEARQQIQSAEHQQLEAQNQLQDVARGNEELRREHHTAERRWETQAQEAMRHRELLEHELSKSNQELNEMRDLIQQSQRQAEKSHALLEQTLRETLRKLDETQQSKAELEHRARALQTQLEELRGKQESPRKSDKKKSER